MKKKLVAILAALTVLACGTTVLAAPSVTASDLVDKVTKVTASNGVEVTLNEVGSAVVEQAYTAATAQKAGSELLALVDVSVSKDAKFPITLTFEVEGVKAGDNIYVLHWNGSKWEVINPSNVADGKVTATFTSLSPVAIVKAPAVADDNNGTTTAPATGASVVLPMAALVCAAGAAGCAKKVKFD